MSHPTTASVKAEISKQPALTPGTPGWWQVWGTTGQDIEPGDYVLTKDDEFYVQDVFETKSPVLSVGVVVDGERSTFGRYAHCVILRRGTRQTLSPHAR